MQGWTNCGSWAMRVRVHLGEPIPRRADEDPQALLSEVRLHMEKTLASWRSD